MLAQLAGKDEADGGLDLARGDRRLLAVRRELCKVNMLAMSHENSAKEKRTGSLGCDALEDIVDERVQDGHGLVGDTSVRVHLLEYCASQVKASQLHAQRKHKTDRN